MVLCVLTWTNSHWFSLSCLFHKFVGFPKMFSSVLWFSPSGDPTSPSQRRSVLGIHWKDWCWSWNSNTLATSCKDLTHWKIPWCWEGLGTKGKRDGGGWDGWMASSTRWAWVSVNSGSWWWTGRPGVLRFMESQRVGHDWATELNIPITYELWGWVLNQVVGCDYLLDTV